MPLQDALRLCLRAGVARELWEPAAQRALPLSPRLADEYWDGFEFGCAGGDQVKHFIGRVELVPPGAAPKDERPTSQ